MKIFSDIKIWQIFFIQNFSQGKYLDDFHENVSEDGHVELIFAKTLAITQYLDASSRKCSRKRTCLDDFCENVLRIWGVFTK